MSAAGPMVRVAGPGAQGHPEPGRALLCRMCRFGRDGCENPGTPRLVSIFFVVGEDAGKDVEKGALFRDFAQVCDGFERDPAAAQE